MSLGSLFLIACIIILIKDRRDWFNYLVVVLAALFFAGTDVGNDIGPKIVEIAQGIDGWIVQLFN